MPLGITKRQINRTAFNAVHNPPNATDSIKASKTMGMEKNKMAKELAPFLMYLYKKYLKATIFEGTDLDMLKLINKAMKQMPGSPAQKKTLDQLNKMRKSVGMKPIGEDINIPINVGDVVLGGKFKNKRIVVKSIGKNEKGDITINGKPLLKYRLVKEGIDFPQYKNKEPQPAAVYGFESPIDVDKSVNTDHIPGGLAQGMSLRDIAKHHNIDFEDIKNFAKLGVKVEMEHTTDKNIAYEIAKDHLYEDPEYYLKLKEDLRKWFGKGKTGSTDGGGWDRYSSDGKKLGKCGDGKEGDAYAACLSKEKAAKLGPDGRASFVRRKRADQKKSGDTKKGGNKTKGKTPTFSKTKANESSINEFGGVRFDAIGYDKSGKKVDMYLPRANNGFEKNIVHAAADKLFKGGKGVEYIEVYYDKHHLGTIKKPQTFTKGKDWSKLPINEIPMGDLQKIDQFADKQLNPVDVVLTDKHFFDRLNDPRNGKEISNAELIGFFKRLARHKKEFVEFLEKYNSVVAVDDRTNINIPFMKQANKAIAKTVMRKKDFKTPDKKLDI